MGTPESRIIEGLVDSSVGEPSPLVGISGGLSGKIRVALFDDAVIVK